MKQDYNDKLNISKVCLILDINRSDLYKYIHVLDLLTYVFDSIAEDVAIERLNNTEIVHLSMDDKHTDILKIFKFKELLNQAGYMNNYNGYSFKRMPSYIADIMIEHLKLINSIINK